MVQFRRRATVGGAITVAGCMIFMSLGACLAVLTDAVRYAGARQAVASATETAARSLQAGYHRKIAEDFGLYVFAETRSGKISRTGTALMQDALLPEPETQKRWGQWLLDRLRGKRQSAETRVPAFPLFGFQAGTTEAVMSAPLTDPEVLERQILELMKFRAPVMLAEEMTTRFRAFRALSASAGMATGRLKLAQQEGDYRTACEKYDKYRVTREAIVQEEITGAGAHTQWEQAAAQARQDAAAVDPEKPETAEAAATSETSARNALTGWRMKAAAGAEQAEMAAGLVRDLMLRQEELRGDISRYEAKVRSGGTEAPEDQALWSEEAQRMRARTDSKKWGEVRDAAESNARALKQFSTALSQLPVLGDITPALTELKNTAVECPPSGYQETAVTDDQRSTARSMMDKVTEAFSENQARLENIRVLPSWRSPEGEYPNAGPSQAPGPETSLKPDKGKGLMDDKTAGESNSSRMLSALSQMGLNARDKLFLTEYLCGTLTGRTQMIRHADGAEDDAPARNLRGRLKSDRPTPLGNAEAEYVLFGHVSMNDNLNEMAAWVMGVRMVSCVISEMLKPGSLEKLTANPLAGVIRILAAAGIQAAGDTQALTEGRTVPLIRLPGGRTDKLLETSYGDYLKIMMLATEDTPKLRRLADILTLTEIPENSGRKLMDFGTELRLRGSADYRVWFSPDRSTVRTGNAGVRTVTAESRVSY